MNWLWKLLGYHVCEKFSSWETLTGEFVRPTSYDIDGLLHFRLTEVRYTKRWQERRCEECGKVQQRSLKD